MWIRPSLFMDAKLGALSAADRLDVHMVAMRQRVCAPNQVFI